jgi:hypothetical protein
VGTYLPFSLNQRLDALVDRLNDSLANTTRKELLAALVLECPDSSDDLTKLLEHYRSSPVEDAAVAGEAPTLF